MEGSAAVILSGLSLPEAGRAQTGPAHDQRGGAGPAPTAGSAQQKLLAQARALAEAGVVVPPEWLDESQAERPCKRRNITNACGPDAGEAAGGAAEESGAAEAPGPRATDMNACWHCTRPFTICAGRPLRHTHMEGGAVHKICKLCDRHKRNRGVTDLTGCRCSVCGRKDVAYRSRPSGGPGGAKVCVECPPPDRTEGPDHCWHCTRPFPVSPTGSLLRFSHEVEGVVHKICGGCAKHKRSNADPDLSKCHCSVCGRKDVAYRTGGGNGRKICVDCFAVDKGQDHCWHCTRPFVVKANGSLQRWNHEVGGVVHKICNPCHSHTMTPGGVDLAGTCKCSLCGRKDVAYRPNRVPKVCVECRPEPEKKPDRCWDCKGPFATNFKGCPQRYNQELRGKVRKVCQSCAYKRKRRARHAEASLGKRKRRADADASLASVPEVYVEECLPTSVPPPPKEPETSNRCWHCTRPFYVNSTGKVVSARHVVDGEVHRICSGCCTHRERNEDPDLSRCQCSVCGRKDLSYRSGRGPKVCMDCHRSGLARYARESGWLVPDV